MYEGRARCVGGCWMEGTKVRAGVAGSEEGLSEIGGKGKGSTSVTSRFCLVQYEVQMSRRTVTKRSTYSNAALVMFGSSK
jgi:hypothetical protein